MDFRIATIEDKCLIQTIAEKTFRDAFARFNTEEDTEKYVQSSFSMQQIEKELNDTQSVFVLVEQDGQTVGYMKLNYAPAQTDLQDSTSLEVERIYVLQAFQGRGMGQQLLDYAINKARTEGMKYMWLGVWEKNLKALRFYEKNGFSKFDEHAFMFGEEAQTDYLMRKDL